MANTPTKRRVFVGTAIGAFLALAAAAIAAFIVLATINGSITTGQFAVYGTEGGTIGNGNETAGTCTVAMTSAGTGQNPTFSVNWTGGPIAGDTCIATVGLQADSTNTRAAIVQGVTMGAGITGGEVTATLGAGCGVTIPTSAGGVGLPVTFTITSAATPSTVLNLAGTTIQLVPAGTQDLSGCS